MNANELRIWNYVMDRGDKVFQIHHWEHETKVSAKPPYIAENGFIGQPAFGHPMTEYIDHLKPIPLTEEWLLKFGFEKPAHSWIGDKFHLSEWDAYPNNWCVAFNKNNAIIIEKLKYVHQLQNLFFALTGEELTIKETKIADYGIDTPLDFQNLDSEQRFFKPK